MSTVTVAPTTDSTLIRKWAFNSGVMKVMEKSHIPIAPQEIEDGFCRLLHYAKFYVVLVDGVDHGVVIFNPQSPQIWRMHLCLGTQSHQTRIAVPMAIKAGTNPGDVVTVIFRSSHRAMCKLTDDLDFSPPTPVYLAWATEPWQQRFRLTNNG